MPTFDYLSPSVGAFPFPSVANVSGKLEAWDYDEAFRRNVGLVSAETQHRLRDCRIAIPGLGGVGGVHLITLARLGVGAFNIADGDAFSIANFNRQFGATVRTVGQNKASAMEAFVRTINPEVKLSTYCKNVTADNVDEFLTGVDILIDGVDFFSIEARRMIFREARRRGIWAITAGPIGFSTAWLVFDPRGMTFDEYFDLDDGMSKMDQLIAFAVGLTPKATQASYMDLAKVDLSTGAAPSVGSACQFASGVAATEVIKILAGKGELRPAPCFQQFDAYQMRFARGRLRYGNRGIVQRLKRRILKAVCKKKGVKLD